MHESFRTFIKRKPQDKNAKVENFCPAMEEANPICPLAQSELEEMMCDVMGDKPYPKRRLRSFQVDSKSIVVCYKSGREEILEQDEKKRVDDGVVVTFDTPEGPCFKGT
ncbi:uncharacterized protein [Amphiura filiformis]|uniref:uncharacterized protein n=1 Tax=Amphiura filiformis TaxID=82378 RepID=UPI003B20C61D